MASVCGRIGRAAFIAVAALNLHAATAIAQGSGREYRQVHLGMELRLTLHSSDGALADSAARVAFARIAALEDVFSDWRPASEVRRLTDQSGKWVTVSPELFEVLAAALHLSRESDGAFDPTIGTLTELWREARRTNALPAEAVIESARRRTGWKRVSLDSATSRVRIGVAGMRIDLGGIAKGWILEAASRVLAREGVASHLIEAGGDIFVGAAPPGTDGWRIVIRDRGRDTTIVVEHAAVATSGTTAQRLTIAGRSYAHLIDPRTGLGLRQSRQVTVVSRSGAVSDGIATALVILDGRAGDRLARRYRVMAVHRSD